MSKLKRAFTILMCILFITPVCIISNMTNVYAEGQTINVVFETHKCGVHCNSQTSKTYTSAGSYYIGKNLTVVMTGSGTSEKGHSNCCNRNGGGHRGPFTYESHSYNPDTGYITISEYTQDQGSGHTCSHCGGCGYAYGDWDWVKATYFVCSDQGKLLDGKQIGSPSGNLT